MRDTTNTANTVIFPVELVMWDCDENFEKEALPSSVDVPVPADIASDEVGDYISDWLSNTYHFCHQGFECQKLSAFETAFETGGA